MTLLRTTMAALGMSTAMIAAGLWCLAIALAMTVPAFRRFP